MKKRILSIFLICILLVCTGCNEDEKKPTSIHHDEVKIEFKNINDADISSIADQKYTGGEIKPVPIIMMDNEALVLGTDYNLTYSNNINPGTATITISGEGIYTGTIDVTFRIVKVNKAKPKALITCSNKEYNGEIQVIAACSGGTISGERKKDAGEYTITCKGDSSHTDASSKKCSISALDISGSTISKISNQKRTGKAITPSPTVALNDVTLVKDIDYIISYKDNINVGTASVTITGKDNYTGTNNTTFKIVNPETPKTEALITCSNKEYNGETQVIATCSGGTISNASQSKVGSYTVTCKGDSTHTDAQSETCKINKANLSKATIGGISSKSYTGSEIKPAPTVTLNGKTLVKGVDYTLNYKDNINVGSAIVVATGKGNYTDTKNKAFTIAKISDTITFKTKTLTYTGKGISTTATAKSGSTVTITYYSDSTCKTKTTTTNGVTVGGAPKSIGTYYAKGSTKASTNYKATTSDCTKVVTINKSAAVITCANKVYNGVAQVIATCKGGTIAGASKTNVGSYTVTCKGDSTHTDAKSKLCSIEAADFTKATIDKIKDQAYTGKQIKPSPTVKVGSKILVKDKDYTVSYQSNINIGTAKLIVAGKENYKGTKTVTFKIVSVAITELKLNKKKLELRINSTFKLTTIITPSNATNKDIIWTSSNKSIVAVDSTGKITTKKPGAATITAKSNNGKIATCEVTVKPIKLLFVGNSKTYYNMYREITINMATSLGYKFVGKQPTYHLNNYNKGGDHFYINILNSEDEIENSYYSFTEGGKSLDYHYNVIINNSKYKKAFSSLEIDYVILQELSSAHLDEKLHKKGIKEIISLLTTKNPNLKVYIRNAWLNKKTSDADFNEAMDVTETVVSDLNKNLASLNLKYKIGIINDGKPVWDAKHEGKEVFIDENGHPNYLANYASALAAVKAMFNVDPHDVTYLPAILNKVNYKNVKGSPYWYGNYKTQCYGKNTCDILLKEQSNINYIKNKVAKY